jgi:hypothetical protein
MALQDVRFHDLVAKLDELSVSYFLWHEVSFTGDLPEVVSFGFNLKVDCERAIRIIMELMPEDPMIVNCSSAASDCLIELKDAIDNHLYWSLDTCVTKLREIRDRLRELRPQGWAMSADHWTWAPMGRASNEVMVKGINSAAIEPSPLSIDQLESADEASGTIELVVNPLVKSAKWGVFLLDAVLILSDYNRDAAMATKARWNNSKDPKLPECVGVGLYHKQKRLMNLTRC